MPCYKFGDPGDTGWICGDLGPHCVDCGRVSDVLCDYPVGKRGKTCSRPNCERCATEVAPDVHYCQAHFPEWERFRAAGGVEKELRGVVPFGPPKKESGR